ncbi:MAG TPA: L,D-transpeptidase [Methyloceanibacter sp.]|jgi:lipoprotein-anchoring transpeptidase ErfK/SrfK|nr:L,D-transpeptidase [Methyloceanibacter sp.]
MKRSRLIAVTLLSAGLACALALPARATILIQIDKPSQVMTVTVDGQVAYRWRVSTGATGFSTPPGTYKPFRMEVMHYSQEWDNAGMPHSIFFTSRGHAVHGSNHPGLGTPVSHGCVRLSLGNASTLFQLVNARGMADTTVVVRGPDPPGYFAATQIPKRKQPSYGAGVGPFQWLFGGSR